MRSPKEMQVIQIELTNACIHRCSNCTRMCGHHKKSFFMDWETFRRAVDSLEGFEGTVGMMGGEPTLHPEFERFARYLASKYEDKKENRFIKPTASFMEDLLLEMRNRNSFYREGAGVNYRIKGPGLWSSLVSNYSKHYELIQDIFYYQCVNDHNTTCYHQPVLVARKDLGIKDGEWKELRDQCWVQNCWSASITPKGAFFCEIAAALDMLFDGPGGWPIEPGWWKRKPEDFTDQLHWCELCGLALATQSRNANEEVDDISPTLYHRLKSIGSPKVREGKVRLYPAPAGKEGEKEPERPEMIRRNQYHDSEFNRVSRDNHTIYPSGFDGILYTRGSDGPETIKACISENLGQLCRLSVIAGQTVIEALRAEPVVKENGKVSLIPDSGIFGRNLNQARYDLDKTRPALLFSTGVRLEAGFSDFMKRYVINPGTYHFCLLPQKEEPFSLARRTEAGKDEYLTLFHWNAMALTRAGFDGVAACRERNDFEQLWEEKKRLSLSDRLLKGNESEALTIRPGVRYAVYGTGDGGRRITEMIREAHANVTFYCDSNSGKWGSCFMGLKIVSPKQLRELRGDFDLVVIASMAYGEIKTILEGEGFREEEIVAPLLT